MGLSIHYVMYSIFGLFPLLIYAAFDVFAMLLIFARVFHYQVYATSTLKQLRRFIDSQDIG